MLYSPSPEYLLFTFSPKDCLCWVENPKIILFAQHLIDTACFLLASLVSHEKYAVVGTISLVKVTHHGSLTTCRELFLVFDFPQFHYDESGHGFLWVYPVWDLPSSSGQEVLAFAKFGDFQPFFSPTLFFCTALFLPSFWDSDNTNVSPFNTVL